jgi:hypothetical protein
MSSKTPVANAVDTALLLDESEAPMDLCSYEGSGSQIECR